MAFGLFITRNDIIKNTPLQGAIDADALRKTNKQIIP